MDIISNEGITISIEILQREVGIPLSLSQTVLGSLLRFSSDALDADGIGRVVIAEEIDEAEKIWVFDYSKFSLGLEDLLATMIIAPGIEATIFDLAIKKSIAAKTKENRSYVFIPSFIAVAYHIPPIEVVGAHITSASSYPTLYNTTSQLNNFERYDFSTTHDYRAVDYS